MAIPSHFNPKIVVAVLGILVAGAPIVGVNAWLKKQGDDEVAITAAWALGSAEIQIGQTIEALQELLARNVDSVSRPTSGSCDRPRWRPLPSSKLL